MAEVVPLGALPAQAVPLSAKSVGTGFGMLFQEPLKPKLALAPVAMAPFQLMLATVTSTRCLTACRTAEFWPRCLRQHRVPRIQIGTRTDRVTGTTIDLGDG